MITERKCWNKATENNFFVLLSIIQKRVLTFESVYGIEGVTIQIKPLQQYFYVVQFVLCESGPLYSVILLFFLAVLFFHILQILLFFSVFYKFCVFLLVTSLLLFATSS